MIGLAISWKRNTQKSYWVIRETVFPFPSSEDTLLPALGTATHTARDGCQDPGALTPPFQVATRTSFWPFPHTFAPDLDLTGWPGSSLIFHPCQQEFGAKLSVVFRIRDNIRVRLGEFFLGLLVSAMCHSTSTHKGQIKWQPGYSWQLKKAKGFVPWKKQLSASMKLVGCGPGLTHDPGSVLGFYKVDIQMLTHIDDGSLTS